MPGSSVGKTQRKCACVSLCGCEWCICDWLARSYMNTRVTETYRHVRLNDVSVDWTWMELSVCSCSFSVALFLTQCLSLSLSLFPSHSLTHTHLQPCGLRQDYQTQACVQLDSLLSHATKHHRGDCKLYFRVTNCSPHYNLSPIF